MVCYNRTNFLSNFFWCLSMVFLVSLNVNGLCSIDKMKSFFALCETNNYDIVALQETHWNDNLINSYKHLWNGEILFCNSPDSNKGVAFLIKNSIKHMVDTVQSYDGRMLHIKLSIDDKILHVINVYAPNIVSNRAEFFNVLSNNIPNEDFKIVVGDFNNTLSSLDRCSKTVHCNDRAFNSLIKCLEKHALYDIWRARNPNELVFSRKQVVQHRLIQSRIDYFLVSKSLGPYVKNIWYSDTSLSDHCFVYMSVDMSQVERGPGVWILNNSLLQDENYKIKMYDLITKEFDCPLYETSLLVWWDNLKYKIKNFSQIYSQKRAKEKKAEFYLLQNKIRKLSQRIAEGEIIDTAKFESLQMELKLLEQEKCKGAILRSKAYWAVESDRNTKFFLNLEKQKRESNAIKELILENGEVTKDNNVIIQSKYNFFSELYSCIDVDDKKMETLLSNIDKTVITEDVEKCDDDINQDEISLAIKEMSNNKSPGCDGLTLEFYKTFYDILGDVLLKLYKEIESQSKLSKTMCLGHISLIYKQRGDKRDLKNWRPITLLNVDYKILARVLANRFKRVLPTIVSENQTCCIIGRDIADTIASIRDVIDLVEQDNLEGYIVKIDQQKAFDRVSHKYLFSVLQKFGFGGKFINWVKLLYTEIYSCVKSNGNLTNYFPLKNSVKQGCPLSALLFTLCAESLCCLVSKNPAIEGITIPMCNKKSLLYQHADDTTLTVKNTSSVFEFLNVFELYGESTGAKINIEKSEILCIGNSTLSNEDLARLKFRECDDVVKILGVYLGTNKSKCAFKNWKDKVSKIKSLLGFWSKRELTIQGRCTVINSLVMSKLWYVLSVFSIPDDIRNEIQKACVKFLWHNGANLVSYQTIIGLKSNGGLKLPDIHLKKMAFRLKFLARFLNDDYNAMWKYTMRYFIYQIEGLKLKNEFLYLNLKLKNFRNLPSFYREILQAWNEIKTDVQLSENIHNCYDQCLFFNPKILDGNQTICWKDFINYQITHLRDITYEVVPGFLSQRSIVEIAQEKDPDVDINSVRVKHSKLLSILPESMKHIVNNNVNPILDTRHVTVDLFINNRKYPFVTCSTCVFYNILVARFSREPVSHAFWQDKFQSDDLFFSARWNVVHDNYKIPEQIDLDFRIFHNAIFTNEKLCKIGKIDSNLCTLCMKESENIVHLFLKCDTLQDFLSYITAQVELLLRNCASSFLSTLCIDEIIILGFPWQKKHVNVKFVNFFLSTVRYCIFKRRKISLSGSFNLSILNLFKYTLKHFVSYFHYYYRNIHKKDLFHQHFIKFNPLIDETEDVLVFKL